MPYYSPQIDSKKHGHIYYLVLGGQMRAMDFFLHSFVQSPFTLLDSTPLKHVSFPNKFLSAEGKTPQSENAQCKATAW